MKASSKFTFTTDRIEPYIPDWRGVKEEDFNDTETEISAKGEAMLMGGISFERKYGIDNDLNPYYQDITHFSGIAGRYSFSAKKKDDQCDNKEADSELNGENPQLIILKPFDIEGEKVYLFKQNDIKKEL